MVKNNVTMRDIAERLGVSTVTVSKALNDKEGVSDELKHRIKSVASELGYRYNTMAKGMKDGCSYNIGVIIAERFTGPNQSFYLQFYQQISQVLEEYRYYGILHILSAEDEEQLALPRIYTERKVDGFIVLGQLSGSYMDVLLETEAPYVFLDFYTDHANVDFVISDNFFGVYEMTNYLIASGHRRIAFVGNIYATSSIQDRFLGYYKSLLEHKIRLEDHFIIPDRDDKGLYIELELPEPLPTAFVCNCDQVAYNLMQTLARAGYRVPEDCSVVGFDNDIYAALTEPKLTTIEVDTEEMARTAVRLILEKLKHEGATHGRVMVKGRMICRDSVRALEFTSLAADQVGKAQR